MTDQMINAITMGFTMLFLVLINAYSPYISRRSFCFGVTIPPDQRQHPGLVAARKTYALRVLVIGVLLSALCFGMLAAVRDADSALVLVVLFPSLEMLVSFIAFLRARRQVQQIKAQAGWRQTYRQVASVDMHQEDDMRGVMLGFAGLYVLLMLATLLVGQMGYAGLPEQVPVHFDAEGSPNGFMQKGPMVIWMPVLFQLVLGLTMIFSIVSIRKSRRSIDPDDPEGSAARGRIFRRAWTQLMLVTALLVGLLLLCMQLLTLGWISTQLVMAATFLLLAIVAVWSTVLTVRLGQGGRRLSEASIRRGTMPRDDDTHWKLGIFYFNREDSALFVEKRFGVGWTCNFARPAAWLLFGGLLALCLGMPLFITLMQ
nr:DUF5808 domain-containing protein [Maliibacterium massiliense]